MTLKSIIIAVPVLGDTYRRSLETTERPYEREEGLYDETVAVTGLAQDLPPIPKGWEAV